MHFTLVRLSTPHMPDTRVFDDVLLPMQYALRRLGYQVECRVNAFEPGSRNICLGANYDPDQRWRKVPPGSILFNLEQLEASGYPWLKDGKYLELLGRFETWDFSRRNIEYLAGRNIAAAFLPLGYVPEMSRLRPCPEPSTDVLFYGAITPRRRKVLDALDSKGLKVLRLDKAFGEARDQALFRSKMLINIHHSLPASLEIVRLGYALANGRAVISELNPDTYHYPELSAACVFGRAEDLPDLAAALAADERAREEQARRGFEAFSSLRLDQSLAELVGRRSVHGLGADLRKAEPRPDSLNLGSGPRFLAGAVNLDSDRNWRPDLNIKFPDDWAEARLYQTERFGEISLEPGSFKRIMLGGMLAASPEPEILLGACHRLLAEGGRLILTLPQPAFSQDVFLESIERGGFGLESRAYLWTELGRVMEARGRALEERISAEGAVEAVRFVLYKKGPFAALGLLAGKGVGEKDASEKAGERLNSGRDIYSFPAPLWAVEDSRDEAGYSPRPQLPPWGRMRIKMIALWFKKQRYRLNLKLGLSGRHDRYREKLIAVEREMEELNRLMSL